MYVSKFRLLNYKSYRDSTEIEFKPGFNIITGQNSAGKTALLEALTAQFEAAPHLSELTVPFRGAMPDEISTVRLTFVISGTELVDLLRAARGREWVFPRPDPYAALPWGISGYDGIQNGMNRVLESLRQQPELPIPLHLNVHLGRRGLGARCA